MADYISVYTSPEGQAQAMAAYQAVLDRWPVPYTEIDVPTSLGQVHVIASGDEHKPPLVLMHALFATATAWYRNVGALSEHFRVYCVDMLGEANKSRLLRPIASADEVLIWLDELLAYLGIQQVCLAGNSFGGLMAAYYAMRRPRRVRRLALIAPASTFHGMWPFYWHMFIPKGLYLCFPWLPGVQQTMRRSVDWMHDGLPRDPLWAPLFHLNMVYGSTAVQVMPRVYTDEEFAQIQAPTMLILGEQEKIYDPAATARAARRLMPQVRVEVIPQAHHITALAQPEAVNERLLRFLMSEA